MLRIVDMREATDTPSSFAVWDTVTCVFICVMTIVVFEDIEEFVTLINREIAMQGGLDSETRKAQLRILRDRVLAILPSP